MRITNINWLVIHTQEISRLTSFEWGSAFASSSNPTTSSILFEKTSSTKILDCYRKRTFMFEDISILEIEWTPTFSISQFRRSRVETMQSGWAIDNDNAFNPSNPKKEKSTQSKNIINLKREIRKRKRIRDCFPFKISMISYYSKHNLTHKKNHILQPLIYSEIIQINSVRRLVRET